MASSRGTLMNRLFMSNEQILSDNIDSLRRLSTKLNESFIPVVPKLFESCAH